MDLLFQVTTSIYNLILGKLYCDHYGTMRIEGNQEYSCKLKFKEQSIIDRNPHQVLYFCCINFIFCYNIFFLYDIKLAFLSGLCNAQYLILKTSKAHTLSECSGSNFRRKKRKKIGLLIVFPRRPSHYSSITVTNFVI